MLEHTLFRRPQTTGLHLLQRRGDRGATELTSWRLALDAGGRQTYTSPDEETVIVLQNGAGTFASGDRSWRVSRANVFEERATALYLPPGRELTVRAERPLEAVLVSTPAPSDDTQREPVLIAPADIEPAARGRQLYSREVHNICVTDPHVRRLMVGETFNPAGHWSSFPPHKHDGKDGEPVLEEVYHFRIDPAQGFGQQMLYTADGENVTHAVRDGDAVLLRYGYHPVAAAPGYRLYYLWAMAGAQRKLALHEDPDHKWIHESQS